MQFTRYILSCHHLHGGCLTFVTGITVVIRCYKRFTQMLFVISHLFVSERGDNGLQYAKCGEVACPGGGGQQLQPPARSHRLHACLARLLRCPAHLNIAAGA